MPRQSRFKGLLAKPIEHPSCPPEADEDHSAFEKFWSAVEKFEARETEIRLRLLFEFYGVKYGAFEDLVYTIAFDCVPGFELRLSSNVNKGGRPKYWTDDRLKSLARDVDSVRDVAPNAKRRGVRGACEYLARSSDFPQWHPPTGRTLATWVDAMRDRYREGTRLLEACYG